MKRFLLLPLNVPPAVFASLANFIDTRRTAASSSLEPGAWSMEVTRGQVDHQRTVMPVKTRVQSNPPRRPFPRASSCRRATALEVELAQLGMRHAVSDHQRPLLVRQNAISP